MRALPPSLLRTAAVRDALGAREAYGRGNYAGFFKAAERAPPVARCLMGMFFNPARARWMKQLHVTGCKGETQARTQPQTLVGYRGSFGSLKPRVPKP